jgi:hypothetical protein
MGLGSASIHDKTTRKGVTNPGNSSEVGILAAGAASPAGLTRFCRKAPGFKWKPRVRITKVGKPEVYRQTRQKNKGVVRVIYIIIYISYIPLHSFSVVPNLDHFVWVAQPPDRGSFRC